jgi:hypothetical protein
MSKKSETKSSKVSANGRPTAHDREQHLALCEFFDCSPKPTGDEATVVDHVIGLDELSIQQSDVIASLESDAIAAQEAWDKERAVLVNQVSVLRNMVASALAARNRTEEANVEIQLQLAARTAA